MKNLTMTNPYYISKHRYYELKHHCLQYPEWERRIAIERSRRLKSGLFIDTSTDGCIDDKVSEIACNVAYLEMWEDEIKKCCEESDPTIANYIFKAVTEGKSYNTLIVDGIPCGREYFYIRYRKFFYLLSKCRE
nr:MAG TPA: hypothetical protein [Caudoviricetes sp.]